MQLQQQLAYTRRQCCQVVEIPAKKLKRAREKSWPDESVAEFCQKWQ
jgi:hypothetical protein